MGKCRRYVGLDVHADTIAVAISERRSISAESDCAGRPLLGFAVLWLGVSDIAFKP